MKKLFYELLLVALGKKERLSRNPSAQEWNAMFDMAKKQAVAGVAFLALDRLSQVGYNLYLYSNGIPGGRF